MEKIEELIKAYETTVEVANDYLKHYNDGKVEAEKQMAIKIIENLNELKSSLPKPVEVPELQFPQSVVDWLETPTEEDHDELLSYIMRYCWNEDSAYDDTIPSEVGEYLAESLSNVVKLLRAVEGESYTVVKEPLYYVPVPHICGTYYVQTDEGGFDVAYGCGDKFTKAEIEQHFPDIKDTAEPVEGEEK